MDLQIPVDEHPDEMITPAEAMLMMMANKYTVGPDMDQTTETITFLDGAEATITAHTFIWDLPGRAATETSQQLLSVAWNVISEAWPPGSYLRWRMRPVFEEKYDEEDQLWMCRLRMRIGAFCLPFVDLESALPNRLDS